MRLILDTARAGNKAGSRPDHQPWTCCQGNFHSYEYIVSILLKRGALLRDCDRYLTAVHAAHGQYHRNRISRRNAGRNLDV